MRVCVWSVEEEEEEGWGSGGAMRFLMAGPM